MAVHGSFNKVWKPVLVSASAILVVVALAGVFLLWHWPFSREAVLKDLEEASTSKVHMDAFHGTIFRDLVANSHTSRSSTIRKPERCR